MKKALAGRPASSTVTAKRLASFGKTNLSECPQPILNCVETAIICCARLTTSLRSVQINIVDVPPFVPPARPTISSLELGKDALLAAVWNRLYEYHQEQKADFALGRMNLGRFMRHGYRPVPVGVDGESLY